jgi:hypothetical protein
MIYFSITAIFLYLGAMLLAFAGGAQYREGEDPNGVNLLFAFAVFIVAAAVQLGALFI